MPIVPGHPRIEIDPEKLGGTPAVTGTRVPVKSVLVEVAHRASIEEAAAEYHISPDDVKACLLYAISLLDRLKPKAPPCECDKLRPAE